MAVPDLIQFTNGTAADADEINQNYDILSDFIDTDCMVLDGSKTFSGNIDFGDNQLLRVATPTDDSDGANKLYADTVIPVGVVQMFVGLEADVPPKWVICDGRELNRTTYSQLWNIINEGGVGRYGNGNGVDTFNVPDMPGFFPYGAVPGAEGGDPDLVNVEHTHVQDEHDHGFTGTGANITGGNHDHDGRENGFVYWADDYGTNQSTVTPPGAGGPWALSWQTKTDGTGGHSHNYTPAGTVANRTAVNQDEGESGVGKNIPPYKGFTFIIRTGV